jgi:PDZ domain (Also known as DHR or GLGF).
MEEWIWELLKGVGFFFLHPLFYIGLFYSIGLGYTRVKRERKNFKIRVQDGLFELRTYLLRGLVPGVLLSALLWIAGVMVPVEFLWAALMVTLLFALFFRPGFLSPAYTAGLAYVLLLAYSYYPVENPFFIPYDHTLERETLTGVALLVGVLIFMEGVLIFRNGSRNTSPKRILSKRGLHVGIHESRRLWNVPLFLLIPGGPFTLPFDFWPLLPGAGNTFRLYLIPFWIGFSRLITDNLPAKAVRTTGKRVALLGVVVTAVAAFGYFFPTASPAAVALALFFRPLLQWLDNWKQKNRPFYFSKNEPGIVVLDIIPGSAAEKMGIQIGEIIRTVNGLSVRTEREFYDALQRNSAFCRLEVLDHNGENRLVTRALYEGEHHELGVIFVDMEGELERNVG